MRHDGEPLLPVRMMSQYPPTNHYAPDVTGLNLDRLSHKASPDYPHQHRSILRPHVADHSVTHDSRAVRATPAPSTHYAHGAASVDGT